MTTSLPTQALRIRLLRGSYFAFLGTLVSVAGNFTVSVILARLLDPARLGAYGLFAVLGAVVIPLLSLAVPTAVTKYTSEFRSRKDPRLSSILATSLVIMIVVGLAGSVLIALVIAPLAAGFFREPTLLPMIQIMALFTVANLIAMYAGAVLQGLEEFAVSGVVGGVAILTNVAFLLWFLVPGGGLVGVVLAASASVTVNAVAGTWATLVALRRHGIAWRWELSRKEAWLIGGFVGPLNAASLLGRVSILVQNSLVAVRLGFIDLGYLRVAGFFYNALLFLPRTLIGPMLPVLSSMTASRTAARQREILGQLMKTSLLLLAPLSGGLVLALPFGIEFFFGAAYLPALPFTMIFVVAAIATFPVAILGGNYLDATGRTKVGLLVTAYGAGVGLLLVVILFPGLGAMALPVSTLVTEGTLFMLLLFWLHRRNELAMRPLIPASGFVTLATAGTIALESLVPSWFALTLAAPVALLLGATGFYLLMDADERLMVVSAFRKGVASLSAR